MMLSYEDALFYKTLARTGFIKEVNEWIDNTIYDNNILEGIMLELACCFDDVNKIISCLHNYLLEHQSDINNQMVCERLRLFIKEKLDNDEISLNDAAGYLCSFVDIEKSVDEYWGKFSNLAYYYELYTDDLLDESEVNIIFSCFIETGNILNINDFWTKRELKYNRKRIKEERKKIEEDNKRESTEIKDKYNLPDNILTRYEYYKLKHNKKFSKRKWILFGIFELLCLSITIGSAFYFKKFSLALSTTILLSGLSFGIYGFCVLCDAKVKGIIHSILPSLCYVIPLVIIYYLLQIKTEWIIGLTTILVGTILFIIYLIIVFRPFIKYEKAYIEYIRKTEDGNEIEFEQCKTNNYISFFKTDGTYVFIFEYKDNYSIIRLYGKFKYNNLKLYHITLVNIKMNDSFENCVKKGIDLLEKYEDLEMEVIKDDCDN